MPEVVNFHIPYHYDKDLEEKRAINMREIERMINNLINGDVTVGSGNSAWAAYTPVLTTSAGSITTQSCSGRYTTISGTVFYVATCQITDIGTGATELLMTTPTTMIGAGYIGNGKEVGVTNDGVTIYATNTTQGSIAFNDGSFPGATGADFRVHGFYETA